MHNLTRAFASRIHKILKKRKTQSEMRRLEPLKGDFGTPAQVPFFLCLLYDVTFKSIMSS